MSLKDQHWCEDCAWPLRFKEKKVLCERLSEIWECLKCSKIYVYHIDKPKPDPEPSKDNDPSPWSWPYGC